MRLIFIALALALPAAFALRIHTPSESGLSMPCALNRAALQDIIEQRDSRPLVISPPEHAPAPAAPAPALASEESDSHGHSQSPAPSPSPTPTPSPITISNKQLQTHTSTSTSTDEPTTSTASSADTTQPSSSDTSSASSISTTSPSSSSSEAPSASASSSALNNHPKQLKSIEYLVPLFVLVLVAIGGWLYSKWYSYRKRHQENIYTIPPVQSLPPALQPPLAPQSGSKGRGWSFGGPRSGAWRSGGMGWSQSDWKSLDDVDEEAPGNERRMDWKSGKDDPWYAGDYEEIKVVECRDVELGGCGVRRANDRGQNPIDSVVSEDRHGHTGQKQVVGASGSPELAGVGSHLARWRSSLDVWKSTRPREDHEDEDDMMTNDGLPRRKTVRLVEPPYRAIPSRASTSVEARTAPGWIMPGSGVALHAQLISPPTQPHLFFHPPLPTPIPQNDIAAEGKMRASETKGTLGSSSSASSTSNETFIPGDVALNVIMREFQLQNQHDRWPTIPSTATGLAKAAGYTYPFTGPQDHYTEVPLQAPRTPKRKTTANGENRTPLAKRTSTMKRSSGRMNLYNEPDSPTLRQTAPSPGAASLAVAVASANGSTPTQNGLLRTPTKSRVQRREDRAQQAVNNILQASWSDRLLVSPPQSIDGLMAMTQPSTSFAALGESPGRASSPLSQMS